MTENQITALMYLCETIDRDICQHTARQVLHARELLLVDPEAKDTRRVIAAFLRFLQDESYIADRVLFSIGSGNTAEELAQEASLDR